MFTDTAAGLLQIVTAAVTPVVLISAAAALILGINQKHNSLSERLRALASEYRSASTTAARREVIRAQVLLFERRFGYAALAHQWLYVGVSFFIGMVLVLTLTPRSLAWDRLALGLFVLGITLMLAAVVAELLEIRLAWQTVRLELRDVTEDELTRPMS